jgi:hypothetical protein
VPDDWKEFESDWREPILRQTLAVAEWAALSAADRLLARKAARGYVAWRGRQRKPPNVLSAHLFLRERSAWPGFAAQAPDAPSVPVSGHDVTSEQGRAIIALYAVARVSPFVNGGRVIYRGEVTPQVLAFASAPEKSAWPFIEDEQQIGAWSAFLRERVLGNRPQLVISRGIGAEERRGISAPWPWPPRKDGSVYADEPAADSGAADAASDDGLGNDDADAPADDNDNNHDHEGDDAA